MGELRIGTSGWSYPTGRGTWNGVFYPPRKGRASSLPGFDELSFYAEHFNTVEVNSSFYGTPRPEVSRGWAERTPAGFEFSLKLYQKFTHPAMYKASRLDDLPATPQQLDALARVNRADVDQFKAGIEPLASAGQARCAARPVSSELQGQRGIPRVSHVAADDLPRISRSRSNCGTAAGATTSATPWNC